ncbi:lamin tail domain-containing protein [Bacteroidota bacterium]
MFKYCIIVIPLFPLFLNAQVTDNFDDGNITANPAWQGNTGSFTVNTSLQLQLDTTGAGQKYLSTASNALSQAEWEFWLNLNFDPSANNQVRIYLCSDSRDLNGPLNGYFLKIGENLANDAIELYRQDGNNETLMGRGVNGNFATKSGSRIQVRHDSSGMWTISSDLNSGYNFSQEFTAFDTSHSLSNYFGFHCKFTSSNSKAFYFDDVYAGPEMIDTSGPKVKYVDAISPTEVDILFDEDLLLDSITTDDFAVWSIQASSFQILDNNKVRCVFPPNSYHSNENAGIIIKNIYDNRGNKSSMPYLFIYYGFELDEILINEIMPDPSPGVNLPESEYIELYNNSNFSANIKDWTISDPTKKTIIHDYSIPAKDYVILCNASDTSLFKPYNIIGLSLPSLNNSSDVIKLHDKYGNLVDSVSYNDSWYKDEIKKEGGWSLELIDPSPNCFLNEYNWSASTNTNGGTPGKENSIFNDNYGQYKAPEIISTEIIADSIIQLTCDMRLLDATNIFWYKIKPIYKPDKNISISEILQPQAHIYQIVCNHLLSENNIYEVEINSLANCMHWGGLVTIQIIIPENTDSNDIVINEILFNPYPNGSDFVEFYNRSSKIIDISELKIASLTDSLSIKTAYPASSEALYLLPGEYIALSAAPENIEANYLVKYPDKLIKTTLPTFPDDEGHVAIINKDNRIIDYFHYRDEYHFDLLDNTEGVSLERISPDGKSNQPANWQSAASGFGYATPTYINSQYSEIKKEETEFWLDPNVFSPDGDGYKDVLIINYAFAGTDNFGRIRIYDVGGRVVKEVVNNDLFGSEGFYSWDGTTAEGELAPIGVYIVLAEFNSLNGKTRKYKRSCTLAKKH